MPLGDTVDFRTWVIIDVREVSTSPEVSALLPTHASTETEPQFRVQMLEFTFHCDLLWCLRMYFYVACCNYSRTKDHTVALFSHFYVFFFGIPNKNSQKCLCPNWRASSSRKSRVSKKCSSCGFVYTPHNLWLYEIGGPGHHNKEHTPAEISAAVAVKTTWFVLKMHAEPLIMKQGQGKLLVFRSPQRELVMQMLE